MKKYIGTKQIEAEPMTMGEAYEKGLLQAGRVPNENEKSNAGYHVRYQDGYESWSPAEPFDKAYKRADTFLDRLYIERTELHDKLTKLRSFIESPKFLETVTDEYQRKLLSKQEGIMQGYLDVLDERMSQLSNKPA
jgi:hypothetical protein